VAPKGFPTRLINQRIQKHCLGKLALKDIKEMEEGEPGESGQGSLNGKSTELQTRGDQHKMGFEKASHSKKKQNKKLGKERD